MDESALSYALTGGSDDCSRRMISAGVDEYGSTLLHILVEGEIQGSFMEYITDIKIKTLLRAGAWMNNSDDNLVTSCSTS